MSSVCASEQVISSDSVNDFSMEEISVGQHNQRAAQHEEAAAQHAQQAAQREIEAATAASHAGQHEREAERALGQTKAHGLSPGQTEPDEQAERATRYWSRRGVVKTCPHSSQRYHGSASTV
jgi:hypothetical protein